LLIKAIVKINCELVSSLFLISSFFYRSIHTKDCYVIFCACKWTTSKKGSRPSFLQLRNMFSHPYLRTLTRLTRAQESFHQKFHTVSSALIQISAKGLTGTIIAIPIEDVTKTLTPPGRSRATPRRPRAANQEPAAAPPPQPSPPSEEAVQRRTAAAGVSSS
jgi:hypothetical protein